MKLSVAVATYNEEENIARCLESIKEIADEIIIVDGGSSDKTVEIAKSFGAKVIITKNHPNFHINKQKAFDLATGDWVLYLDADEKISSKLSNEIKKVINLNDTELEEYQENLENKGIFDKHKKILELRDGQIGKDDGQYVAFFFPRLNLFLGKFLKYGGVYPDGVIRLFKRKKAYLPCKSVHEQMVVNGRAGWLENDLLHFDSPTFDRYLQKNNRYIDLIVLNLKKRNLSKNFMSFFYYCVFRPIFWFLNTQIRHKGILDGWQGVVFSFFSALRFPRAYIRYIQTK